FDGDLVIAGVTGARRDKERSAKVEMLLGRGKLKIVGRLHLGFRQSWVESLDEKFPYDIDIDKENAAGLDDGWIVVALVTLYPGARRNPQGVIIENLAASSDKPGMDINIVIHKHDLPHIFPDEVVAEAEAVSPVVTKDQIVDRLDLREDPTVTIDG